MKKKMKNKGKKKKSNSIGEAFRSIKREKFVPSQYQNFAYEDTALPIGHGQTISQPYTIAFMLNLLDVKDGQKILEIGSGSGYVLALLSKINPNGTVIGVERIKDFVNSSRENLKEYKNIKVFHANGFNGFEKEAPYERILVSAAAKRIPPPLIEQLKLNGILVIPIGNSIIKFQKKKNKNDIQEHEGFVFVPLLEN